MEFLGFVSLIKEFDKEMKEVESIISFEFVKMLNEKK